MSEAEPAGGDTDEFDSMEEESGDCVPGKGSAALSNEFMLDEAERARYTERSLNLDATANGDVSYCKLKPFL